MFRKRLLLVVPPILLIAAVLVAGASQTTSVRVPPGAIVESPGARSGPEAAPAAVPAAPALGPASGPVAFADDFSSSDLGKWQSLASAPGSWAVKEGRLVQQGDVKGDVADTDAVLISKGLAARDGIFEAYVYPTSGQRAGVAFRGSDAGYYRVTLYANNPNALPKALLERVSAAEAQKVAEAPVSTWAGYTRSQWHLVRVQMAGSRISVSINGTEIIGASDSAYSAGWIGVWTAADMGAQFDNVRVQSAASR